MSDPCSSRPATHTDSRALASPWESCSFTHACSGAARSRTGLCPEASLVEESDLLSEGSDSFKWGRGGYTEEMASKRDLKGWTAISGDERKPLPQGWGAGGRGQGGEGRGGYPRNTATARLRQPERQAKDWGLCGSVCCATGWSSGRWDGEDRPQAQRPGCKNGP